MKENRASRRPLWRPNRSIKSVAIVTTVVFTCILMSRQLQMLNSLSYDDYEEGSSFDQWHGLRLRSGGLSRKGRNEKIESWERALEEAQRKQAKSNSGISALVSKETHQTKNADNSARNGLKKKNVDSEVSTDSLFRRGGMALERTSESLGNLIEGLDEFLVRDVTLVITPRFGFYSVQNHLEAVMGTIPQVSILYVVNEFMPKPLREYLSQQSEESERKLRVLEVDAYHDAAGMRNASIPHLRTKYALFLYADVFPSSSQWLHYMYQSAEWHEEGGLVVPLVWESSFPSSRIIPALKNPHNQNHEPQLRLSSPIAIELSFDDYSNDGKLYIDQSEANVEDRDLKGLGLIHISGPIDDHCVFVHTAVLRDTNLFDPLGRHSWNAVQLALSLRFTGWKAFFVPQAKFVVHAADMGFLPHDLSFFAIQKGEDACADGIVHMRKKWGIISSQVCRQEVDLALRPLTWKSHHLQGSAAWKTRLVISFFSLIGFNRFQIKGLPGWEHSEPAPQVPCSASNKRDCPDISPDLLESSDAVTMLSALKNLDSVLRKAASEARGEDYSDSEKIFHPVLFLARAEVHPKIRLVRVEDREHANPLQSGKLFRVRKGILKKGDPHPGRRAPVFPVLSRLYLAFMLIEMELRTNLKREDRISSIENGDSGCVGSAMSLITEEYCAESTKTERIVDSDQTGGSLLGTGGQSCSPDEKYYRAWMLIREADSAKKPENAFGEFSMKLLRGSNIQGWVDGSTIEPQMSSCWKGIIRRVKFTLCIPWLGENCMFTFPLGAGVEAWDLKVWSWRPLSLKAAEILLFDQDYLLLG